MIHTRGETHSSSQTPTVVVLEKRALLGTLQPIAREVCGRAIRRV
jgi:hypothetical protein